MTTKTGKSKTVKKTAAKKTTFKLTKGALIAKLRKDMAKREAEFKKLSRAEKRVAIAKDVLAMISSRMIKPTQGTYFNLEVKPETVEDKVTKSIVTDDLCMKGDAREFFLDADLPSCEVCALGSMMVAHVVRADAVKVEEIIEPSTNERWNAARSDYEKTVAITDRSREDIVEPLLEYFTKAQLSEIEGAFEGRVGDHTKILKDIMENIIANKGEFVPRDDDENWEYVD